jgi:hypothetical protein
MSPFKACPSEFVNSRRCCGTETVAAAVADRVAARLVQKAREIAAVAVWRV